jgi:hypothetical protein
MLVLFGAIIASDSGAERRRQPNDDNTSFEIRWSSLDVGILWSSVTSVVTSVVWPSGDLSSALNCVVKS